MFTPVRSDSLPIVNPSVRAFLIAGIQKSLIL
jgi:hypothetical protein